MTTILGGHRGPVRLGSGHPRVRLAANPVPPVPWEGDTAGEFHEPLLDQRHLIEVTGLTFSVNSPTKDATGPLLQPAGTNTSTWDYQKLYCSMVYDGSTWRLFYGAADTSGGNDTDRGYMATSTDGTSFTKPNLGVVTIGGNGNNNAVMDYRLTSCRYYPALAKWVATAERHGSDTLNYIFIFTADDPAAGFTLVKTIAPGHHVEGKDIVQREDGRWLAYYSDGHDLDRRFVGAYLSDAAGLAGLAGTWSWVGSLLAGTSSSDQRYGIGVERVGDIFYGLVMRYSSAVERTYLDLYFSRDGQAWTLLKTNWLPLGTSGAFDDELIFSGNRLAEVGNTWWLYYTGSPVIHTTPRPKDMRIGRASIGKGRVGQVAATTVGVTGSLTTELLQATAGQTLSVNANASGGRVEIELLGADALTLAGYARDDAVDITADTYATEPTWAGSLHLPTNQPVHLRFHVTDATVFGYTIA